MINGKELKEIWFTQNKVNEDSSENINKLKEYLNSHTKQKWLFINDYNNSVGDNYLIYRGEDAYAAIKNLDYSQNEIGDFLTQKTISKLRNSIEGNNTIQFRIASKLKVEYWQLEGHYKNKHGLIFDIYKSTKLKFKAEIKKDNKEIGLQSIQPIVSKFKTALFDDMNGISAMNNNNGEEEKKTWNKLEIFTNSKGEIFQIYKAENQNKYKGGAFIRISLKKLKEELNKLSLLDKIKLFIIKKFNILKAKLTYYYNKYKKLIKLITKILIIIFILFILIYGINKYINMNNRYIPIDIATSGTGELILQSGEKGLISYEGNFNKAIKSHYTGFSTGNILEGSYGEGIINFTGSINENNFGIINGTSNLSFTGNLIGTGTINFSGINFLGDITDGKLIGSTNIRLNNTFTEMNDNIYGDFYIYFDGNTENKEGRISGKGKIKFSGNQNQIKEIDKTKSQEFLNNKISIILQEKIKDIIQFEVNKKISDNILNSNRVFQELINKYLKDEIINNKVIVESSNKNLDEKLINNTNIYDEYLSNLEIFNEINNIYEKSITENSKQVIQSLSGSLYLSGSTMIFTKSGTINTYIDEMYLNINNIDYTSTISIDDIILKNILNSLNKENKLIIEKELKSINILIKSIDIKSLKDIFPKIDIIQENIKSMNISNKEKIKVLNLIKSIKSEEENIIQKDVTVEVIGSKLGNSIGIAVAGGLFDTIITKNTELPTKKEKEYYTSVEYQKNIDILVYEGENKYIKDNTKLGRFIINLEPVKNIGKRIKVEFNVNEEGKIFVNVIDLLNKNNKIEVEVNAEINKEENRTETVTLSTVLVVKYIKELSNILENIIQ